MKNGMVQYLYLIQERFERIRYMPRIEHLTQKVTKNLF
ncbi:hypothetical protein PAECIP111802_07278 [Paenibacillus allorhizosphaerae]|uniref:Uncharacterized protein n=1 Tax=Paenibacillus allorhizosphaerae TaxID=2849866 RepID=A0ABN7U1K2_9BACL|nr:hypothetical protein PAECIP111802_07278 [Paenibacillus allorhizosphaerae]